MGNVDLGVERGSKVKKNCSKYTVRSHTCVIQLLSVGHFFGGFYLILITKQLKIWDLECSLAGFC